MPYNKLIRLGGLVGILTGAVSILFNLGRLAQVVPDALDHPRAMATFIFLIFTLVAIYARQYQKAGILGLLGLFLTVTALIYNVAFRYINTFIVPPLIGNQEALTAAFGGPQINSFIMFVWLLLPVGYTLFGVATFRAGILPRWATLLIILGPILGYVGAMSPALSAIGSLITYIGITWLSVGLFTGVPGKAPAVRTQPVLE